MVLLLREIYWVVVFQPLLCKKAYIIFFHRMFLQFNCLNTWLLAGCHIIFIAYEYTILLLQTQNKVIPIKF